MQEMPPLHGDPLAISFLPSSIADSAPLSIPYVPSSIACVPSTVGDSTPLSARRWRSLARPLARSLARSLLLVLFLRDLLPLVLRQVDRRVLARYAHDPLLEARKYPGSQPNEPSAKPVVVALLRELHLLVVLGRPLLDDLYRAPFLLDEDLGVRSEVVRDDGDHQEAAGRYGSEQRKHLRVLQRRKAGRPRA